jgi:hypothetical protein
MSHEQNYEGYDLSEESDRSRGVHGSEMRDREIEVRYVGVGTSDLVRNIVSQNRTTSLPNHGMATSSCNKPAAPLYFRRGYSFSNDATNSRSAGGSVLVHRKLPSENYLLNLMYQLYLVYFLCAIQFYSAFISSQL